MAQKFTIGPVPIASTIAAFWPPRRTRKNKIRKLDIEEVQTMTIPDNGAVLSRRPFAGRTIFLS
jgi:hypothetical protein